MCCTEMESEKKNGKMNYLWSTVGITSAVLTTDLMFIFVLYRLPATGSRSQGIPGNSLV